MAYSGYRGPGVPPLTIREKFCPCQECIDRRKALEEEALQEAVPIQQKLLHEAALKIRGEDV